MTGRRDGKATRIHMPASVHVVGGVVLHTSAIISECGNRLNSPRRDDAIACHKCAELRDIKVSRSLDPQCSPR